tara:strand:+ start:742 stop:1011 length:270 start_codon:yes stop_codon:yes gene_type:complete
MNILYKPKLNIVCKTQGTKIQKKKVRKYSTYKDLKLEMNKKKPSDDNKVNPFKKFFTKIFGNEIDYEKFNKESKWAIRINEEDGKTKKW